MIDELELERLLHDEADAYDLPPGGPEAILDEATDYEDHRSRLRWMPWMGAAAGVVAVAVALSMAARGGPMTGGSDSAPASAPGYNTTVSEAGSKSDYGFTGGGEGGAGGGANDLRYGDPGETDPAVVRTGSVLITVPKARVADTLREAARIAGARGGFVADSNAETASDTPSGFVTVRVPVKEFEATVEQLSRLGDVRSASTQGEDVTDQVTDTAARLKSLGATRDQLRALLARAKDVGEVLAVQQRMTDVQTQIEQLQAKQEALADRTAYGTVRLSVQPPGGGERTGFAKSWHDAVDGFVGGFEGLVAASGAIAFVLVVGGVLLVAGRRAYRYWLRGTV